jgi:hypothetical protein
MRRHDVREGGQRAVVAATSVAFSPMWKMEMQSRIEMGIEMEMTIVMETETPR